MSHKKPRRPRWPAAVNPLSVALAGAARHTDAEVRHNMAPALAALTAMRQGIAALADWMVLSSTVGLALHIERGGVVRGLHDHLASADTALQQIHQRATAHGAWLAVALQFDELDALVTAVDLHRYQLQQLSGRELRSAYRAALQSVARAGGRLAPAAQVFSQQALQHVAQSHKEEFSRFGL